MTRTFETHPSSPTSSQLRPTASQTRCVPSSRTREEGGQTLLRSPTQPSTLAPAQVKAFGPGLEPTGCIVDKPAEFTIDARAAGKGDLKLYAQVGCCPIFLPLAAGAGTLGG